MIHIRFEHCRILLLTLLRFSKIIYFNIFKNSGQIILRIICGSLRRLFFPPLKILNSSLKPQEDPRRPWRAVGKNKCVNIIFKKQRFFLFWASKVKSQTMFLFLMWRVKLEKIIFFVVDSSADLTMRRDFVLPIRPHLLCDSWKISLNLFKHFWTMLWIKIVIFSELFPSSWDSCGILLMGLKIRWPVLEIFQLYRSSFNKVKITL